jgi:tetratricopeptide (TPR) repeat protein
MTERERANTRGAGWLAALLILGCGLFAYWGTWNGRYVFDDITAIRDNTALQTGDWWNAAFGSRHQPLANRPLSCWTLTIDFALFGPGPFGPHVTNLLLHLANALLIWSLASRCARAPNLAGHLLQSSSRRLALAIACLWVVHPLGVEAVAYATQRSTLLASFFLLVALRATLRAHAAQQPFGWRALAVAALAAAMASKEDAVAGPLLLPLFERAFLLPSWSALRARAGYYGAVAATWLVLIACVALGPTNETIGYQTAVPVSAWQWLVTQARAVAWYVRLALWPHGLRTAYDWDSITNLGDAAVPGAFVLALLVAAVLAWRRRPWLGWLGALFFLLLAPTSTVLPIYTEVVAERRVYLPMLFVLAPVVVGGWWTARRLRIPPVSVAILCAVVVATLAVVTRTRVEAYRDLDVFWEDAFGKRDPESLSFLSGMICVNYANVLAQSGRLKEAYELYDRIPLYPVSSDYAVGRYAMSLVQRRRFEHAVSMLRSVTADRWEPFLSGQLGVALAVWCAETGARPGDPRLGEAEDLLRRSLAVLPDAREMWRALASVLQAQGRIEEAGEAGRRAASEGAR